MGRAQETPELQPPASAGDSSAPNPLDERDGLAAGYRATAGAFDEMIDQHGALRPRWADLLGALDGMGRAERQVRVESVRRNLRENGVTYNVYDDPQGAARPWPLDPFPFLVAPDDWAVLAAGLQQR